MLSSGISQRLRGDAPPPADWLDGAVRSGGMCTIKIWFPVKGFLWFYLYNIAPCFARFHFDLLHPPQQLQLKRYAPPQRMLHIFCNEASLEWIALKAISPTFIQSDGDNIRLRQNCSVIWVGVPASERASIAIYIRALPARMTAAAARLTASLRRVTANRRSYVQ